MSYTVGMREYLSDEQISQLMARVSHSRQPRPGACAQCGAPTYGIRTKRYCSNACAQRAKRARARGPGSSSSSSSSPRSPPDASVSI